MWKIQNVSYKKTLLTTYLVFLKFFGRWNLYLLHLEAGVVVFFHLGELKGDFIRFIRLRHWLSNALELWP